MNVVQPQWLTIGGWRQSSDLFGVGCYGYKSCFSSDIQGVFVDCLGSHSCFAAESIVQPVALDVGVFDGIRCDGAASCMNAERIEFDYAVTCAGAERDSGNDFNYHLMIDGKVSGS